MAKKVRLVAPSVPEDDAPDVEWAIYFAGMLRYVSVLGRLTAEQTGDERTAIKIIGRGPHGIISEIISKSCPTALAEHDGHRHVGFQNFSRLDNKVVPLGPYRNVDDLAEAAEEAFTNEGGADGIARMIGRLYEDEPETREVRIAFDPRAFASGKLEISPEALDRLFERLNSGI